MHTLHIIALMTFLIQSILSGKRPFFVKRGRLNFIQSVLSGFPNYFMSVSSIHVVSKSLEKTTRDFPLKEIDEGVGAHSVS